MRRRADFASVKSRLRQGARLPRRRPGAASGSRGAVPVNDAALHGIPGRRRLADGDLLSVDSGAVLGGWAADAAISFTIGPQVLTAP
ncbi:MAG: M24 family metallopeptidase [Streptosporangiaceae bacterium]